MTIHDVIRDINAIKKHYKDLLQADHVLKGADILSWYNYEPGVHGGMAYVREYQRLLDRQQYSFLFSDLSFVQFYYDFSQGNLQKSKLAFYPAPVSSDEELDDLIEDLDHCTPETEDVLYEHIERLEREGVRPTNVSHIRIDFDRNVESHCQAHMQFGGINDLRISSNRVLMPLSFMESIAQAFYPKKRLELLEKPGYREDLVRAKRVSLESRVRTRNQCFLSI